ncbi:serine/threonine-protein kinase OXI1-like [Cornus florida]|uniref:serine/threonine-protein kinase OXI1-like n=1 Tax=Cornus florida TaxID=4283 RepID=UPI00289B5C95|nr:serine/threonine-protein kinase OXI1-like [Cornus florida]
MDGGDNHILELGRLKVIAALGRGAKGVVFLVRGESRDSEFLALKAISKASIEKKKKMNQTTTTCDSEYKRICFEQQVLSRFQHPLLPRLRGVLATDHIIGYAIDYCPGRDLNYLRKKQTEKTFSDDTIRFYAAELVLALEYLHGLGIVYRDLKPENVMIQENGHLMLVDFDLSTKLSPKSPENIVPVVTSVDKPAPMNKRPFKPFYRCCNSGILPEDSVSPPKSVTHTVSSGSDSAAKSNSFVGTEEYVAPEIILGNGHDFGVDWWCLGVVLYEMLYGMTPFRGSNRKETFYRILTKSPELVGDPTPLRELIAKLLEKDPKQRISLEGIKGHDFFCGVDWDLILQIGRPPFIPVRVEDEDTEGNKEIDVESFVQGIFEPGRVEANSSRSLENKNNEKNTDNGVWIEGLDHPCKTDKFFVF